MAGASRTLCFSGRRKSYITIEDPAALDVSEEEHKLPVWIREGRWRIEVLNMANLLNRAFLLVGTEKSETEPDGR